MKMKIICLGDSLTFGNVGYSYIHFLDKKSNHQYVNKGKNGDTVSGMYSRLKKLINKSKYNSEIYILGIGTNDILLPYLRTVSLLWFLQMSLRCKLMKCIEDDEIFCQKYSRVLELFYRNNKQVIIFGMPFINLKDFPDGRLKKRNKLIKELAYKYHYPFIDIYKLQKENIGEKSCAYTWKYRLLIRFMDAILMTLFPFTKDYFAKIRGLSTTVDGVHFNSKSAKVLALEIEKYIIAK
ncbi:SGNH/GDSL hydrolase family protein [Johnsonella ignava]|nr:SGNH/GDSL hydrolase family protein [Johnsonella ignava]